LVIPQQQQIPRPIAIPRPQMPIAFQQRVVAPLVIPQQPQLQIPRPIAIPRPQMPIAFQQRVVAPVVIPQQQPIIITPPPRPQMPIAFQQRVVAPVVIPQQQPRIITPPPRPRRRRVLPAPIARAYPTLDVINELLNPLEANWIIGDAIKNKLARKQLDTLRQKKQEEQQKKALVKSLNVNDTQQEKLNVLAMAISEPSFVNPMQYPIKIQRLFRKIKARRERRELLSLVEPLNINMPQEKSDVLSMAISQPSFDVSKVFKEDIKAKRKAKKDAIKIDKLMTKSEERLAKETLKQLDAEREEDKRIVEQEERLRIANEEYKIIREKQKQEKEALRLKQEQEKLLNDTSSDVIKRTIAKKAAKEKGKKLLIELKIKHEKEIQTKDNAIDVIKRNIEQKVMRNKAKKELAEIKLKNQEKQMELKIATSSDIIKRAITKNALKVKGRKQLEELKIKQQQEKDELIRKQEEERLKIEASSDIIKRVVAMKALKSKGKKQLQELKIKQQQEKEKIMGNAIDVIKRTFERNALRSKMNATINEIKIKDQEQKELLELQKKQYKIAKKQEIINKSKELKKLKKQQPVDFKLSNLIKLSKADAKKMGLEDGKSWFEDEDTSADYVQMNINRFQKQLNKVNDKLKTDLTMEEEKWNKNKQIYLSSIISVFKNRIGNLKTNAEVKQEKLKKLDEDIKKSEEKIKLLEYVAKISAKNNVEEEMSLSMSISDAELFYENTVKEYHNYRDDERNEKILAKPIVSVLTDDAYRKVIEKLEYYSKKLDYIRKFTRQIEEQNDEIYQYQKFYNNKIKSIQEELYPLYTEYQNDKYDMGYEEREEKYNELIKLYDKYLVIRESMTDSDFWTIERMFPEIKIFKDVKFLKDDDYELEKIRELQQQEEAAQEEEQQQTQTTEYTKEEVDSWSFEEVKQWLRDQGYYSDTGLTAPIKGVDADTDRYAFNAYQRFKRAQSKK